MKLRHLKQLLGTASAIFINRVRDRYFNYLLQSPACSSEETEAQRGPAPCSRSHSKRSAPAERLEPVPSRVQCDPPPKKPSLRPAYPSLTRIVSTRLCTLAGFSTDGSGRMRTLSGTLCTAAMQPEWMLPPCAPPLGPGPPGAPRPTPAPALPSAPPARIPMAPPPPAAAAAAAPPASFNPGRAVPLRAGGGGGRRGERVSPPPGSGPAPRAPLAARGAGAGLGPSTGGRPAASPPPHRVPEWKRPGGLTQGESAGRGAGGARLTQRPG